MIRKLIGACVGLAMMGVAGTANAITVGFSGRITNLDGGGIVPIGTTYSGVLLYDESALPLFSDAVQSIYSLDSYELKIAGFTLIAGNSRAVVGSSGTEFQGLSFLPGNNIVNGFTIDTAGFGIRLTNPGKNLPQLRDFDNAAANYFSLIALSGERSSTFGSSNLSFMAVPIPAALPLMSTDLAVLGLLGWRRKRAA
jgi:hypothetical protein